jgi:hypothetical protein
MTVTRRTLILALATTAPLAANPYVWTNGAPADLNWSTANNWLPGLPPKALTTDVILAGNQDPGVGIITQVPIVNQPWTVRSLQLNQATGSPFYYPLIPVSLNGQTITLGSGGISQATDEFQQINNPLTIAANQTWDNSLSTRQAPVILAGPIHFSPPAVASFFELSLAGGGDYNPNNSGHFQIRNDITGTGRISVNSGCLLRIGKVGTINATDSIFRIREGGEMRLAYDTAATVNVATLDVQSGGFLQLDGNLHEIRMNTLQGGGHIFNGAGTGNGRLRHVGTSTQSFPGRLTGINFFKEGTGTLLLTGPSRNSSNYSTINQLNLQAGRLVTEGSSFTHLQTGTLTGAGTLEIRDGSGVQVSGTSNFDGLLDGDGLFEVRGSLTLSAPSSQLPEHSIGQLDLEGSLTLSLSHVMNADSLVGNGFGVLTLAQNSELRLDGGAFGGTIANTGTIAAPHGRIVLADTGTLNLFGTDKQHSFDRFTFGPTSTLQVRNSGDLLVRSYVGSGTLRATEDATIFLGESPGFPFSATLDAEGGNVTILGGNRFSLTAPGRSHGIGHLNIGSNGLDLGGASSLTLGRLSGSSSLTVNSGSTLTITGFHNSPFTGTFQNGPDGGGTLALSSAGTKVLRAGSFTGTTTLSGAGSIYQSQPLTAPAGPITIAAEARLDATDINNPSTTVHGELRLTSVPSPGGPLHGGCLTGTYTQSAGSRLVVEINDRPSRPTGYGRVRTTGNLNLAGNLTVHFANTFNAQPGDTWTIYQTTAGTLSGTVTPTLNASNLPPDTHLVWNQTPTSLTLQLLYLDPPGYFTWASTMQLGPANRSPFLDPDADGRPNWHEYLLGLDPLLSDALPGPEVEFITDAGEPAARFRIGTETPFFDEFEVQASTDLGLTDPWDISKVIFAGSGVTEPITGYRVASYRFHLPSATAPRAYFRIRYKGLTAHPND